MSKRPPIQSPPKRSDRKEKKKESPPAPMRLLDRWQVLARHPQYAKDYKIFAQWNKRTPLERHFEEDPEILTQIQQIESRKQLAGLLVMPDPCTIPRIIQKARSGAEKQVPRDYKSKTKNRTCENAVLEKMEQVLPVIFQNQLTAVRQVFYKCPPTEHKGQMIKTDSAIRDGKYCMVEIDITGGTRAELLEQVGTIIDHGRDVVKFERSPQRGPLKRGLDHWAIFDQVKTGKNYHQIAKELLRTADNATGDYGVAAKYKQVKRADQHAQDMLKIGYSLA